jgi:hypothetical protein
MSDHNITPAAHDAHRHHHDPHGPALPFTDAQMDELHKADIGAGGAVVVLMTAIFTIGLALYSLIAIVVAV